MSLQAKFVKPGYKFNRMELAVAFGVGIILAYALKSKKLNI